MKGKGNAFGVAGFVLGLIGLLTSFILIGIVFVILGIVFSGIQMKRSSGGLSIAGLVLSIIGLIIFLIVVFSIVISIPKVDNEVTSNAKENAVLIKYSYKYLEDGKIMEGTSGGSGVILKYTDKIKVMTNRHVVDCRYNFMCKQKIEENIQVMTYDGKIHTVSRVYISPNQLDLAILSLNDSLEDYPNTEIADKYSLNDPVFAIGYPAFSFNAREFSIGKGRINNIRELITEEGQKFNAIDSQAYASFGSSGGGLFNNKGQVIGLTTWGDGVYSYAIASDSFPEISEYKSCIDGYLLDEECAEYCSYFLNEELKCVSPCEDFYCNMEKIYAEDFRCLDSSMIMGSDGFCYYPCGSNQHYCKESNSYCFENKCLVCRSGYELYENGLCY